MSFSKYNSMIQLTLIQLDNYGPWTTHPSPKREADLQIIQSNIYADLQKQFSTKKALVLPMRYDNLLAVTNQLTEEDHQQILDSINLRYPFTVSMSVACGETPYIAQKKATENLVKEGGAQHEHRKARLCIEATTDDLVKIAHIDINNVTKHTDEDVYRSYKRVVDVHQMLIDELMKKQALAFFMGGDNFIAVFNGLEKGDLLQVFDKIKKELDAPLKAGVGLAKTAQEATHLASLGLKEIRRGLKEAVVFKKQ